MTDPENTPSTEAGRRLRELYAVLPTTDEGWRLAEEWMTGPLLNEQHGSVPERIKRIEEQARAEGRQQAVQGLLRAYAIFRRDSDHTDAVKVDRAYAGLFAELDRVAGLNASESGQPPEASDE